MIKVILWHHSMIKMTLCCTAGSQQICKILHVVNFFTRARDRNQIAIPWILSCFVNNNRGFPSFTIICQTSSPINFEQSSKICRYVSINFPLPRMYGVIVSYCVCGIRFMWMHLISTERVPLALPVISSEDFRNDGISVWLIFVVLLFFLLWCSTRNNDLCNLTSGTGALLLIKLPSLSHNI